MPKITAKCPGILVRVIPQDYQLIRDVADQKGTSMAALIRQALGEMLSKVAPDAAPLYIPAEQVPIRPLSRKHPPHVNNRADIRPIDERHIPQSQATRVEQATYAQVQTSVGMDGGLLLREAPRARRR